MSVPYSLSFYDLLQYPLFKMAARQNDEGLMKEIFYQAGMDTSKKFEIVEVLHRPLTTTDAWFGLRVQGEERLDKEHLNSGIATLEAQMFTKDLSLRLELCRLDPRNCVSKKRSGYEDEVGTSGVEVYDGGEDCV